MRRVRIEIEETFPSTLAGRENIAVSLEWIAERLRRGNTWDKGPITTWRLVEADESE